MPTIFNSKANSNTVKLFLRTLRNETLTIIVEATATVYELKTFVCRKYQISVQTQQLFHQGRLLKDKRCLSVYKLHEKSTVTHPILLTQALDVKIIISQKVLSLLSLSLPNDAKKKKKKKLLCHQMIQCGETTTIDTILKQLNLTHLSHILKVCVGSEAEDIDDTEQKVMHISTLVEDGMMSILFSTRWFVDRSACIDACSHKISQTLQKCIDSVKALKARASFRKLDKQFAKTEAFLLSQFEAIKTVLNDEYHEISKALKWCKKLKRNSDHNTDIDAIKLLNQIQNKVENIDNSLKKANKKWNKKQKQIVAYLQDAVRCLEDELMAKYKTWTSNDVMEWLQYMDDRIIFSRDSKKQFKNANIMGYNISDLNQLSLKLMNVKDVQIRSLIVGYIDTLIKRYANTQKNDLIDASFHFENNVCCVCVTDEINTVISPCGHAVYCADCSKKSAKHCDRCPICREKVESIITVYKAGFNCVENY